MEIQKVSYITLVEYLIYYIDKLVYVRFLKIPIKLKSKPEPRYNYTDYLYNLKQNL